MAIKTISKEIFEENFGTLYAQIFSDSIESFIPLPKKLWERVAVPYAFHWEDPISDALLSAIKKVGDNELLATNVEAYPIHELSYVITIDDKTIYHLRYDTQFSLINCAIFGKSAKWGGVCCDAHDFTVLAGVPEFVEEFSALAGGREYLQQDFYRYANDKTEWHIKQPLKEKVMRSVGWPWPD